MTVQIPRELVCAAMAAAQEHRLDVADVPLTAIAAQAGVSRSTLLRRLGGTRAALDDAVRAAGVDPGGRTPVRERAIEAAASLISEHGLATVTLDAVAAEAGCSLPTLHTVFGGRDGLLTAIFDRYSPVLDVEELAAAPPGDAEASVRGIYRALIRAFGRQPRVLPALFADLFSRPDGPASQVLAENFPRLFQGVASLLMGEVRAGRFRPLPPTVLIHLLVGPLATHMLLRPALNAIDPAIGLPSVAEVGDMFADAFLRAVGTPISE